MSSIMSKTRKSCAILLASISCICLFGCSSNNNIASSSAASSENIKTMIAQGDLSNYYHSLPELEKDAVAIIEGKVLDTNTVVYADTPFTISNVQIVSSKKGAEKTGNTIKVIETGGIYSLTGENPKEKKGELVDYQFEGIPVMKTNEHVYLFLDKFDGPQVTGAYVPLGVYQGKFKFDEKSNVVQQAPTDWRIKELDNLNKANFEKKVDQVMAK